MTEEKKKLTMAINHAWENEYFKDLIRYRINRLNGFDDYKRKFKQDMSKYEAEDAINWLIIHDEESVQIMCDLCDEEEAKEAK